MRCKNETDFANPYEAFRRLVLQRVQTLSPRMGLKPGTLWNKADADEDSRNQPTLRDVILVTSLTGDMAIIDSLNEMFGRATFDAKSHESTSDAALLELLTAMGIQKGKFHQALHHALVDGKFSQDELKLIRATAYDVIGALMTVVSRVEGLVDE